MKEARLPTHLTSKNRQWRRALNLSCQMEVLETRALLSAMTAHAAAAISSHGPTAVTAPARPTPTPIANLTGNPLTFSEVVGLPAVQSSALPAVQNSALPAVQDIATITSSTIPPHLNGYKVSVDWGDGSKATAGFLVVDNAGLIHVKGFHVYKAVGTFSVTITVTQLKPTPASGTTAPTLTIVSTADVTQNSSGGVTITTGAHQPFSGTVGTFSIPTTDTTTDVTTFKALINWGDHHTSLGTIILNPDGSYTVAGDHTYTHAGTFRISILVVQTVPPPTPTASSSDDDSGNDRCEHPIERRHVIALIFSTADVTPITPTTPTT